MLNSRLGETRPEQEWSNGTEFSGYSDFPEFKANLARYTQYFGMKFRKMTVPFTLHPGISGIFVRMESALDLRSSVGFFCRGILRPSSIVFNSPFEHDVI